MGDEPTEELDFDQTDFEFAMGQRKFKRQTKEQQIYGMFADDDEDERPSFGAGTSRKRQQKESAPVKFVAGGVKVGSKTQLPDGTTEEDVVVEEEIVVTARPEKRTRTSFAPSTSATMSQKEAGSQVFAGMRTATFFQSTSNDAFGNSGFGNAKGSDSSWIGKGSVIMNMMKNMGYEQGKGLGKSKQGIVEPVQAVQRPGRGAVGAYGSEAKGPKFGESAAEAQARLRVDGGDTSEATGTVQSAQQKWKKSNAGRVKVHYKTIDEVISDGTEAATQFGGAAGAGIGKIIDMTGPEQKVYDDFSSFSRRARRPEAGDAARANFDIPELSHNLDTLLDVAEEEIFKTDKQIRHLKDQNEVQLLEQERIEVELDNSRSEIRRLEDVDRLIRSFYQANSQREDGPGSLEECKSLFIRLRDEYAAEYILYGLDAIAIPILLPRIQAFFSQWDPLDPDQQNYGFTMMEEWKEILGHTKGGPLLRHFDKDKGSSISAFEHCIWSGWMPNLRRAALGWSPRNNGPVMHSLVQLWAPLLPDWVLENLLEQMLVPRIKEQVDQWDPVTDPQPIEGWLHPWHSLMGDRLLNVYSILRQKLAKGLRNWFPGDRSAIESIRPWRNIFSSGTMHGFIGLHIVPKLEKALQNIDMASTEHFDYLELFDWIGLTSAEVISQTLVKCFFPRLYQEFFYRLSSADLSLAQLEKIKRSYMDWKNLMHPDVLKHELVMGELKRILLAISQVQGRLVGGASHQQKQEQHRPQLPQHQAPMPPGPFGLPPPPAQFTAQLPPASFKQLVESSAVSNGIQFFPQRSKFQESKQVYMFGDFSVYIDATLLYYYSPPKRQWLPASLNQMLDMVRGR